MKVLLVGQGGREHVIAMALARSKFHPKLAAYMSSINPGIAELSSSVFKGSLKDVDRIVSFAQVEHVDLVVIGPEEPLMHGVIDRLKGTGIPGFGPTQALANLEGNKALLRKIIAKAVPEANPTYLECVTREQVHQMIAQVHNVAVKPIGLTGGKGVRVSGKQLINEKEAEVYALEVLEKDGKVLLEEFLDGEEYSQMVFSDGVHLIPMPLAQDAKYAYEGDQGLMTGGMGSYTQADQLLPFVNENERKKSFEILKKVIQSAQEEFGEPYHGVLYGQFMLTRNGPKLVETNARFGDPEAINIVSLLRSDAVDVFMGAATTLPEKIEFKPMASVCKYLVPEGYPETKPEPVSVKIKPSVFSEENTQLVYAGAEKQDGHIVATGSRFAAILAIRPTVAAAEEAVERTIQRLDLKGVRHRPDVATAALLNQRVEHMQRVMQRP